MNKDEYEKKIKSMETALRASDLVMLKVLDEEINTWQEATGCDSPEQAKTLINMLRGASNDLVQTVLSWQKATGCNSPEAAETTIKNLKDQLGGFIQAASCAESYLEHILLNKVGEVVL